MQYYTSGNFDNTTASSLTLTEEGKRTEDKRTATLSFWGTGSETGPTSAIVGTKDAATLGSLTLTYEGEGAVNFKDHIFTLMITQVVPLAVDPSGKLVGALTGRINQNNTTVSVSFADTLTFTATTGRQYTYSVTPASPSGLGTPTDLKGTVTAVPAVPLPAVAGTSLLLLVGFGAYRLITRRRMT